MGVSTDAILAYGINIGEHDFDDEELYDKLSWRKEDEPIDGFDDDVQVTWHCSDSCPMFFMTLKSMTFKAHRGYPQKVDISKLSNIDLLAASEKIKQALKTLGIETEEEPSWQIFSYWG